MQRICLVIIFLAYCLIPTNAQDHESAQFVSFAGGSFIMGDQFGLGEPDERPLHTVSVDGFLIATHELTVGEFRQFVEATGYQTTAEKRGNASVYVVGVGSVKDSTANWQSPGFPYNDRYPVVLVSWIDAVHYCNWRSEQEGYESCYSFQGEEVTCDFSKSGYRLPTEAEWEYAARSGGKDYRFGWGNGHPGDEGKRWANVRDMVLGRATGTTGVWREYEDGYVYAAPVGTFEPNEAGLYDISGNVYEWCWDWLDENYYAVSPSHNPSGPESGEYRACRDVGFICYQEKARITRRGYGKTDLAFSWGGFRICRNR